MELAKEIWVTIRLNVDRGLILAKNEEAKLGLEKLLDKWKLELFPEEQGYVPD